MRKKLGVILIALGVFALVLGALSRYYAHNELAVAPLDRDSSSAEGAEDPPSVSEGTDATIFSLAAGLQEIQTDLVSTRNTVGQVEDSEKLSDATGDRLAIYETFSYTEDGEGRVLSGTFDRVIFDRKSGETVDCPADLAELCDEKTGSTIGAGRLEQLIDEAGTDDLTEVFGGAEELTFLAPGDKPVNPGDRPFNGFEGQFFKMPFDTQKTTYQWWDGSLREATDMVYQDTEEIDGLTTYRFEQVIPPTDIADQELPASVTGFEDDVIADRMYSNTRTLWIEPETGAVIKAQEDQLTTFDYEGEPLITATDATIGYNEETVQFNVEYYESDASQLALVRFWVPVFSLFGLVFIAVGIFLLVTGRRRSRSGTGTDSGSRTSTPTHAGTR